MQVFNYVSIKPYLNELLQAIVIHYEELGAFGYLKLTYITKYILLSHIISQLSFNKIRAQSLDRKESVIFPPFLSIFRKFCVISIRQCSFVACAMFAIALDVEVNSGGGDISNIQCDHMIRYQIQDKYYKNHDSSWFQCNQSLQL